MSLMTAGFNTTWEVTKHLSITDNILIATNIRIESILTKLEADGKLIKYGYEYILPENMDLIQQRSDYVKLRGKFICVSGTSLNLRRYQIKEISEIIGLENFPQLTRIDLSENKITTTQGL